MSISAMKQALEALDSDDPSIQLRAAVALRQAIEQAEKQEPVVSEQAIVDRFLSNNFFVLKAITAPPKKQWVSLTDEEIKEIIGPWGETPIKGYTRKLFDQIEAKLKEKNT